MQPILFYHTKLDSSAVPRSGKPPFEAQAPLTHNGAFNKTTKTDFHDSALRSMFPMATGYAPEQNQINSSAARQTPGCPPIRLGLRLTKTVVANTSPRRDSMAARTDTFDRVLL